MGDMSAEGWTVDGVATSMLPIDHREPSCFLVRVAIANLGQLAAAFGEDAAATTLAEISRRAGVILNGDGDQAVRDDGIDVIVDVSHEIVRRAILGSEARALEQAFNAIVVPPIATSSGPVLVAAGIAALDIAALGPSPRAAAIGAGWERLDGLLRDRSPALSMPASTAPWAANYAADMRRAVLAHVAMAEDRMVLAWQPILGGASGRRILYSEGLARIVDPDRQFGEAGRIVEAEAFAPALERLGLTRAVDAHVVRLTMAKLIADPAAYLGCNVSAQSAVLDGWWTAIVDDLDRDHGLASRLTLQIADRTRPPSLPAAIDFTREMRHLLCRIAIDDFGRGPMSVSDVAALAPDVIKINAFFLHRAERPDGIDALAQLINLAAVLGRAVVIGGVSTRAAELLAGEAGAGWMQGDFIAAPAMKLLINDDAAPDGTALFDDGGFDVKPGITIPLRRLVLLLGVSLLLWGMIGGGLWLIFAR